MDIATSVLRSVRIQQLLLVQEIAESGSIVAAAKKLNITQSAATKNLQNLENALGSVLFKRSRSGLESTLVAPRVLLACERIITELMRTQVDITALAAGQQGKVRVGALIAVTPVLLPQVVLLMRQQFPSVAIEVVDGTLEVLTPKLLSGEIDLILGRLDARAASPEIVQKVLYEDDVVLAVRDGHPLLSKRKLSLADLATLDWILPPKGTSLRDELELAFHESGLVPAAPIIESVSLAVNITLVQQSDVILALPKQVFKNHRKTDKLRQLSLKLPAVKNKIGYMLAQHVEPSQVTQSFIDVLQLQARKLVGSNRLLK